MSTRPPYRHKTEHADERVTVRIPASMRAWLKGKGASDGRKQSAVVVELIQKEMEKETRHE